MEDAQNDPITDSIYVFVLTGYIPRDGLFKLRSIIALGLLFVIRSGFLYYDCFKHSFLEMFYAFKDHNV